MSGRDAFEDEMGFERRISDREAEGLLSDPSRDGAPAAPPQVVAFVRALPAAVPVRPSTGLEAMVVTRAAEAARTAGLGAARHSTTTLKAAGGWPSWQRRIAVAALAIALVPVVMAGLAIAGVTLPEPARDAFESVGIDLPNQSEADDGTPAGAEDGRNGEEPRTSKGGRGEGDQGAAESQGQAKQPGDGEGADGNGGNGRSGQSRGGGPESTPPGHGATPPGQGGVPPGQGAPPPGHEVVPPSEGGEAPGQGGTAPGQEELAPGHGEVPPGQDGVPPGQASKPD
jgi:hypothetical protein